MMKLLSKIIFILCFLNSFVYASYDFSNNIRFEKCSGNICYYEDLTNNESFYIDYSKIPLAELKSISLLSVYIDDVKINSDSIFESGNNAEYDDYYEKCSFSEYTFTSTVPCYDDFCSYINKGDVNEYKEALSKSVAFSLARNDDFFYQYLNTNNISKLNNTPHYFLKVGCIDSFSCGFTFFENSKTYDYCEVTALCPKSDYYTYEPKCGGYYKKDVNVDIKVNYFFKYDGFVSNISYLLRNSNILKKYAYSTSQETTLQPFDKLFPLSFDLKKQLYELPAKDRKDFFCRAKFGGSVSYANNTRIMPFYANLRFLKQPTSNSAIIDLKNSLFGDKQMTKKDKMTFAVILSVGTTAIYNILKPTSISPTSDLSYNQLMEELAQYDVQKKNQVCEFDCVDEVGNIQTAKMPFYYDLETKSINHDALSICSNVTMKEYDIWNSELSFNYQMTSFEQQLFELELQKYIADYILAPKKEFNSNYYNELLKEYYDPSLDEIYSLWADTHILEQARATYQSKVFEAEKNNLLDMLNKGGFSETSIDYYKKFLDDETINKYRQAKLEADRRLEEILNGKDGGFKADENANSNTVTGVPPVDSNLTDNKMPPPPPPIPDTDKNGGFKGDITISKPGAVGGGIGVVGGIGNSVANDVVIGGNTNIKDQAKDDINNQAQAQDKTKENSKADDVTITKDSTTTVDRTQTGSKVDVNVKTDVNVDVNVKAKVDLADIPFEPEDIDFELDEIEKKLNILDSVLFFQQDFTNNIKKFLDSFSNIIDELNETKEYFKNLKNPQVVNPAYKNTCPFSKKLEFYGFTIPIEFDICKLVSIIYPATFSFFYVLFFYVFFKLSFKFARAMGAFKLKLK